MPPAQRLAVFAGAAVGTSPRVADQVRLFGKTLAAQGITVVYGGGRAGLMGILADSVLEAGGEIIGVIPSSLVERELAHERLTKLYVVDTMHDRKARMAELADAFVALPGGSGTLEEFFEVWTWSTLGFHRKPVCLLDIAGAWTSLIAALDDMAERGFIDQHHRDALVVSQKPETLLAQLTAWTPPQARFA